MYERIVLAYDGSREGRAALREGAILAKRFGAEVFILSVVAETPGVRIGEAAHAGAVAHTQDTYKSLFDEAMSKLAKLGLTGQGRIVVGEPAQEIAAYAKGVKADLVVVGHRKQGVLERWWSGATGAYLTDHLTCSLLIARNTVSDAEFFEVFEREAQASA
jgi:nucleotide-binding universal stress UspA family protein